MRESKRVGRKTQRAEIIGCACALINLYTLPGCEYHQSSSFLPRDASVHSLVDDTCVCFAMIGHTRADPLIESTVGVRELFSFIRILSEIGLPPPLPPSLSVFLSFFAMCTFYLLRARGACFRG